MSNGVGARAGCHLIRAGTVGQLGVELYTIRPSGQRGKLSSMPGHAKDDRVSADHGDKELSIKLFMNCLN
jgi:hypothetical protein